ncbi:hypothetical protein WH279_21635 [Erwinia sp. MYb375]|uniref:hypothetical protein n=1 Tax=unclassified Erwinia TaxID=2622719 RepID=UPI0030990761
MEFINRIKKEMSEGIVKAILENYNYRVIDTGIEKVIREVSFLPIEAYNALGFPDALRKLPDFVVMDSEQKLKLLVDVKYRSVWSSNLLLDRNIIKQVELFRELVLIVINAAPPNVSPKRVNHNPVAYIRCVILSLKDGVYKVKKRNYSHKDEWIVVDENSVKKFSWFSTHTLAQVFPKIKDEYNNEIIKSAVNALSGVINHQKS